MKLFRITTAALFLGSATTAFAQTQAESFADQFKTMQSLQAVGTYTFKPTPKVNGKPTDPVFKQSFADNFAAMQAAASNSAQWNGPEGDLGASTYASAPADPAVKEPFANSFAEMQAASSNSDAWKFAPAQGAPAHATAANTTVARPATQPAFADRIARALRGQAASASY
jgi:hypothetical protein